MLYTHKITFIVYQQSQENLKKKNALCAHTVICYPPPLLLPYKVKSIPQKRFSTGYTGIWTHTPFHKSLICLLVDEKGLNQFKLVGYMTQVFVMKQLQQHKYFSPFCHTQTFSKLLSKQKTRAIFAQWSWTLIITRWQYYNRLRQLEYYTTKKATI